MGLREVSEDSLPKGKEKLLFLKYLIRKPETESAFYRKISMSKMGNKRQRYFIR